MDVRLLPDLFADQAARTPDAPAVIDGHGQVGYAALDAQSNRLAHLLREAAAGPESLVGICLPRGLDLIVTLLAVWKAGAAYVPLDPSHPTERLRWMLADSGAGVLVTNRAAQQRIGETGAQVVFLDELKARTRAVPQTPLLSGLIPANTAYTIYTSGSTGRPKGVQVSHAAIANRVRWTVREHALGAADRVLHKTTISFDAAGWEIFAPLVSGGAVVLAPEGADRDPAELVRSVARFGVTVLQVVPSLLRLMVDEDGWADCGALRLLFSAGEPLEAQLCQRLNKRTPVQVWNTYGPTECAIDVTAHAVDPGQLTGQVPIGRPIANMRILVLDPAGKLVPIGVPGELHVAGVGLARGYHGLPGLTAERFVPDPHGPPGSRMYRTGDRVRWHADGTLEYVGRLDHQVKVNGVRIEPAEVESALSVHPGLRGAVVTAFAGADGVARLVAYVTSGNGQIPPEELRGFLRGTLPTSLIPSIFVPMDAFPLTPSGKVDRAALPSPEPGGAADRSAAPPLTPAERMVAQVWAELLGVKDLAARDDFFQLGGSSLLLAKLASRLAAAAGRELAVPDLFTASTLAAQARLVADSAQPVVPMRRVARGAPLPLSFEQQQLWFLDQMQPGNPEWVTPLLVRLPCDLTAETVRAALTALVTRHELLRTRYLGNLGEPRQVADEPGPVPLPIADSPGDRRELSRLIGSVLEQGFDLARGPVWRALLVRTPGQEHVLVLAVHHIASDGRSSVVLGDDIRELCAALAGGREPDLAPLPVQYADYAVWQRQRLTDSVLEPHLRFWRRELDGAVPLELPTDRPRPAVRDPRGTALTFGVPVRTAEGVAELSRRRGVTPFATYLTAFATLLARWSRQWDVAVGAPVAGRTRPETAALVGPFLNSIVLRCRLAADQSFSYALGQVWQTSRSAFACQDLPFERVVEELRPARDLSRTPLYQVMFNFMDEGVTVTGADDLDALEGAWRVAKTDLTLFLHVAADGGGVTGILEYATALFGRSTIARMAGQFIRLLDAVLTDPAASLRTLGARADVPQGAVERRMAKIWAGLLGRAVGVTENFFQTGGTSRLALVLMAQLQEDFDLDLPVRLIFERPTIAQLSEAVKDLAVAELEQSSGAQVMAGSAQAKEPQA